MRHVEGVAERLPILHQQAAGLVGLEEPLVGIKPDRVGALDTAQELPAPLGHDREPAVGGIDVEPQVFGFAEVRQFLKRVDRAGAGGTGIGADGDGGQAGGAVVGDGPGEGLHVEPEAAVARDLADVVSANPDDHGGAGEGAMALVAHVDGGSLGVAGGLAGGDERVDTGGGAAAGEETGGGFRVADPAPEPVDDDEFDLAGAARDEPRALVEEVARSQEVGDDAGPRWRGGNEAEEARVIEARAEGEHVPREPFQHLGGRVGALGGILTKVIFQNPPELAVPGLLRGEVLETVHEEVKSLAPEFEHLLVRHLQSAGQGVRLVTYMFLGHLHFLHSPSKLRSWGRLTSGERQRV